MSLTFTRFLIFFSIRNLTPTTISLIAFSFLFLLFAYCIIQSKPFSTKLYSFSMFSILKCISIMIIHPILPSSSKTLCLCCLISSHSRMLSYILLYFFYLLPLFPYIFSFIFFSLPLILLPFSFLSLYSLLPFIALFFLFLCTLSFPLSFLFLPFVSLAFFFFRVLIDFILFSYRLVS